MEADRCTEEAESSDEIDDGADHAVWEMSTGVCARAIGLCRLSRKVCVALKMNLRFQRWNRCNTRRVSPCPNDLERCA